MIAEYGGLARQMPIYATYFLIMALSSMGLPLLNGFIGEFTILQGAFARSFWWALLRRHRHRPRRRVPAVALPADLLRRALQPGEREAARPDRARAADARAARVLGVLDRPLSEAALRRAADAVREDRPRPSAARPKRPPALSRGTRRAAPPRRPRRTPARHGERRTPSDWFLLSPELFLTAAGLLAARAAPSSSARRKRGVPGLPRGPAVVVDRRDARVRGRRGAARGKGPILAGMFVVDNFALFFKFADPALDRC